MHRSLPVLFSISLFALSSFLVSVTCEIIDSPMVVARQDWSVYSKGLLDQISLPERTFLERYPTQKIVLRQWLRGKLLDTSLLSELTSPDPASLFVQTFDRAVGMLRDSGQLRDLTPLFEAYRLNETFPSAIIPTILAKGKNGGPPHTIVPYVSEPYSYICDAAKLKQLGFSVPPKTSTELIDMFVKAKAAGYTPMVLPVGNEFNFASNLYISMNGDKATFDLGSGKLSFRSKEVVRWAEALQHFHSEGYVTVAKDGSQLEIFMTDQAVCTWTTAALPTVLGYAPGTATVFLPPPWDGEGFEDTDITKVFGTAFQINMGVLAEAKHADSGYEAIELVIKKFQENPRADHGMRNLFLLPEDRAADGSDLGPIYKLADVVPALDVLFVPAFTEAFIAKIKFKLFANTVVGDVQTPTVPLDVIEIVDSLEALRLELILSRASPPIVSVKSGIYNEPFSVTLSSPTESATVLFTTDGKSDPRKSGLAFSDPIPIGEGTTILRAIASAPGLELSEPVTVTYKVEIEEGVSTTLIIGASAGGFVALVIAVATVATIILKRKHGVPPVPEIDPGEISFEEVVGIGSRGVVYKGTWRGSSVAIKLYMSPEELKTAVNDVRVQKAIKDSDKTFGSKGHGSGSGNPNAAIVSSGAKKEVAKNVMNLLLLGNSQNASASIARSAGKMITSEGSLRMTTASNNNKDSYALNSKTGTATAKSAKRTWADVRRELDTIAAMRSPNLVTVYGTVKIHGTSGVVLEWMGNGSLYNAIHNPAITLGPKKKLEISLGIARGIGHLHAQKPAVLHRDIKSLNCLLSNNLEAKVADFDLAVLCDKKKGEKGHLETHRSTGSRRTLGTIPWAAPEVFRTDGSEHTPAADVFAFGVVLWEIFTRREPFSGTQMDTHAKIKGFVTGGGRLDIPGQHVPEAVAELIRQCWREDPKRRPKMEQISDKLAELFVEQEPDHDPSTDKGLSLECARLIIGPPKIKALQKEIAQGSRPDAIPIPSAAVIFTDVVSFTTISGSMDPVDVAGMLGRLFAGFDEIAETYGGVKYKIVGDAYILIIPPKLAAGRGTEAEARRASRLDSVNSSNATFAQGAMARRYTVNEEYDLPGQATPPMASKEVSFTGTPVITRGNSVMASPLMASKKVSHTSNISLDAVSVAHGKEDDGHHVIRAATIGIRMAAHAARTLIDDSDPVKGALQIRVGMHVGPIAAQIMDSTTIEFLGDTMNIASRLETSSEPGRVHVSNEASKILQDSISQFTLVPRGNMQLKGVKGEMSTWFVSPATRKAPVPSPSNASLPVVREN